MALGKPHAGTTSWHQCHYATVAECNEAWRQLSASRKLELQAAEAQRAEDKFVAREAAYARYETKERARVAVVQEYARLFNAALEPHDAERQALREKVFQASV